MLCVRVSFWINSSRFVWNIYFGFGTIKMTVSANIFDGSNSNFLSRDAEAHPLRALLKTNFYDLEERFLFVMFMVDLKVRLPYKSPSSITFHMVCRSRAVFPQCVIAKQTLISCPVGIYTILIKPKTSTCIHNLGVQ